MAKAEVLPYVERVVNVHASSVGKEGDENLFSSIWSTAIHYWPSEFTADVPDHPWAKKYAELTQQAPVTEG